MKRLFAFLLVFLLLVSPVLAQVDTSRLDDAREKVESFQERVDKAREFTEEDKWEYLGSAWTEFALKSEGVVMIDSFLRELNWLFFFLLGMDYKLSLTFFFAILWWVAILRIFEKVFVGFTTFSVSVGYIVAFLVATISAHLGVFDYLSNLTFRLLFFNGGIWPYMAFFMVVFGYIFAVVYIERIIWQIGRAFKKSKEERDKWDAKFEMQIARDKLKSLGAAADTINKSLRS